MFVDTRNLLKHIAYHLSYRKPYDEYVVVLNRDNFIYVTGMNIEFQNHISSGNKVIGTTSSTKPLLEHIANYHMPHICKNGTIDASKIFPGEYKYIKSLTGKRRKWHKWSISGVG